MTPEVTGDGRNRSSSNNDGFEIQSHRLIHLYSYFVSGKTDLSETTEEAVACIIGESVVRVLIVFNVVMLPYIRNR